MRQTEVITLAQPNSSLSCQFDAVAVQISNPTSSRVTFRQGGTDFPTANSADFVVPAKTLLRLPAVGNSFAFGFIDLATLNASAIKVARITALDINESLSSIGSIQTGPGPSYYEKERNPTAINRLSNLNIAASGTVTNFVYQPALGRAAYISNFSYSVSTGAALANVANVVVIPSNDNAANFPWIVRNGSIHNAGDSIFVAIANPVFLSSNDAIWDIQSWSSVGAINVATSLSISGIEYDA